MKYLLLFVGLVGLSAALSAQNTFTDYLQRKVPGKGEVVLHQDATIENLVNGLSTKKNQTTTKTVEKKEPVKSETRTETETNTNTTPPAAVKRKYGKAQGYRIQIYAGGNSRDARREAQKIGLQCQSHYPELAVYTHFLPPRWVCRVGDFRSYEEANTYMVEMKERKLFREATIVKSMVVVVL